MSSRGRRAFHRGSFGRGSERGSPESADSSNSHSGDGPQVGGGAERSQSVRGRGRGSRGTHNSRGGHARGFRRSGSITSFAPEPDAQQVNIDAHIADDSDRQILTATARHTVQDITGSGYPLRPDFGTSGKQITLHTNFFPVRVPDRPLYEYHLHTTPHLVQQRVIQRVLCLAEQTAAWTEAGMRGNVVHDSHMRLISTVQLPQPLRIAVPYYRVEDETGPAEQCSRVYTLSITLIQELSMEHLASYLAGEPNFRNYDALPALAALNTILTSVSTRVDIMVGRHRYFSVASADITELGGGLEAWTGFQSILKPVHKQLMVNVGVCTLAFRTPGNLARAMIEFDRNSFGARTGAFLRGVKIRTTHLGHRKTIKRVSRLTARTFSFDTPEYGRVTLEDYFRQKYNVRLRYHDLPLIDVGGNGTKYLPAEVCGILSGQCFHGVLMGEQAAAMTAMGRRSPSANKTAIVNHVRDQLALDMTRPELHSFGMTIGQDMIKVQARILPKPRIEYLSGAALIDDRASWNLKGVKFVVGARLENWAVLVIKDGSSDEFSGSEDEDLRWVVARFCDMCHVSGMQVADDPKYITAQLSQSDPFDIDSPRWTAAFQKIRSALLSVNPKPTVLLVVLANKDSAIYDGLKYLCDVTLDVATVCVQSSKFRRSNPHYLANVTLKANMKLGGINHKPDPSSRAWLNSVPTMIVGIHVHHPRPGSVAGTPSIMAVMSSIDDDFGQYPAKLEIQGAEMEMGADLKSGMIDNLRLFQTKNKGKLPERIIIYRSDVSENQSDHVRSAELPRILEASSTFYSDRPSKPKVVIIICDKRHQVRFYPTDASTDESAGNPLPGTVVDRNITDIYGFDFFLQSHDALSGTARPIHYTVIHYEIGLRADELQGVTHSLSYMFARTTKSVRLASPASYAELASQRGRCYLRDLYLRVMMVGGDIRPEGGEQRVWQEVQKLWGRGVSGAGLKNTMFYL